MCLVVVGKSIYMFVAVIGAPNFPIWRMTGYEIDVCTLNFKSKKINIVTKKARDGDRFK